MRILVVAGEASGDALVAPVVAALRALGHAVVGVGGDACAAAGLELVGHARSLAAHGLVEALPTLPVFVRSLQRLEGLLPQVDVALLVDFPELNRRLLAAAHRRRVPAAWLAPPQAWAWRPWRVRDVAQAAWVGCLFPFEVEWLRRRGVAAEWVGHPRAEPEPPPLPPTARLALLPGSRDGAVHHLLPTMLAALAHLRRRHPTLTACLPVAATVDRGFIHRAVVASGLPVMLVESAASALNQSTFALAGAGTATLDCALAGRPCVVMARLHPATAALARRLVHTPFVGLPNLILGRALLPECIQAECTPEAVAAAAEGLLDFDPAALAEVRRRCHRPHWSARVAARVVALTQATPNPLI